MSLIPTTSGHMFGTLGTSSFLLVFLVTSQGLLEDHKKEPSKLLFPSLSGFYQPLLYPLYLLTFLKLAHAGQTL